jgi:xanthine dehydrogenase YagS FAD-binding subunit
MKNFTFYRPRTPEQAVALLDAKWGTTELLAGGTDLLDLQKEYVAQPDKVISLNGLRAAFTGDPDFRLHNIVVSPDGQTFTIGALKKLADIAEHALVREAMPALATAAGDVGGPQIRNMGTLGGNLCQRNRCWYFRDEHVNCLLKGGDRCYARDGENRYHAVFARGHNCVIVHPSTLAPVLIALGARAEVLGAKGRHSVELAKFFHAPQAAGEREHVLAPNEMVLWVEVPVAGRKNASYEVRHKQSYDWPLVQAAVAFRLADGKAKDVRIVLGHVAPTPHVAQAASEALEGNEVTEASAAAAGEAATEGARPLSQTGYKLKLIAVAVKRALLTAAGHKKYWEV